MVPYYRQKYYLQILLDECKYVTNKDKVNKANRDIRLIMHDKK